jgi:2-polyprenyl-3-methyl-5-hydroxy-6-metoxy-1,4-benzoquinol methylase
MAWYSDVMDKPPREQVRRSSNREGVAMKRPDPVARTEADKGYADHYARSHEDVDPDPSYRLKYCEIAMLDAFLDEGYALLDVGCGTAGYHKLLRRHGSVVGLDFSRSMIDAAIELAQRQGMRDAIYLAGRFEDYEPDRKFDGISFAGIYGWYRSWRGAQDIMNRLAAMLNPGGLVILSHVPPRGAAGTLKSWAMGGRTVLLPESEFSKMLGASGLTEVLTLSKPHTRICFARKL